MLLNDRYDIWKVAADGSGAENLTKIGRDAEDPLPPDPAATTRTTPTDRGIDLSKPHAARGREPAARATPGSTGWSRAQQPKLLVMGARAVRHRRRKAKDADVYLLTVSTFSDYPDYYVADPDFHELKRVTDINPQVKEFNWGKAELVHYKSTDGVPLPGVLVKPENFDPTKKYPMIVYIYERLSQNLHRFRLPTAGHVDQPDLLRQQRLPRADAGHRLHGRLARARAP